MDLHQEMQARGVPSEVVAISRSGERSSLPVTCLGGLGVRSIRSLRRRTNRASVVIAHGSRALPASVLACAGRTSFVYRSVGDPAYWSARGIRRLRTTLMLRQAAHIVTLWSGAKDTLAQRGVGRDRISVIGNAVDVGRFPVPNQDERRRARSALGIDQEVPVASYVGALSVEKRPDRMIRLAEQRPGLRVLLAGDGPLRPEIESACDHLPNTNLLGTLENTYDLYAATDVVVVPSETEGIPAVAIEAGLCGVPVVACDVGGLGVAVLHQRTGILCSDPAQLVDGVDAALDLRSSFGPAARAHCEATFGIDHATDRWIAVLSRVVNGGP